jgi:diguanylate cyclase (GGDEF)-like protein
VSGAPVPEQHLGGAIEAIRLVLARLPGSGLILLDSELVVRAAEGPACGAREMTTARVRGRPLADLLPERVWCDVEPHYRRAATGAGGRFSLVSSDGRRHDVEASPVVGPDDVVTGVLIVSQDTTDRAEVTAELRARLAQQSVVRALGQHALEGRPLDALMDEAVREVATTLGADLCGLLEHDPVPDEFVVRAGTGWAPGFVGRRLSGASMRAAGGLEALAEGPLIFRDLREETRFRGGPLEEHGVVSGMTVLIGDPERPFGLLGAHTRVPRVFAEEDATFLALVGNVVGHAIHRARAEERTRHDALHDPLTGLPNRTLLLDRLRHALERSQRTERPLALLFTDLDGFKVVNDTLGHAAGDEVLRQVAPRLTATVRAADTVARFGGDEFVVLCEDLHGPEEAEGTAGRIAAALAEPVRAGAGERVLTTSTGVIVARGGTVTPEELLRDADAAMYRAKARGPGTWERA